MSHGNNEGRGVVGGVRRCVAGIGAGRVEGKRAVGGWCEGRGKRGVGRVRVLSSRVDARARAYVLFQERPAAQDDVRGVDHGAEPRDHAPLQTLAAVARATLNRKETRACPARRLVNLLRMGFPPSSSV